MLVVVGLLALIAMAGLALDTSHVLLNKSRLQSALDAAALAAAKALDQSASTATATTAAGSVFALNLAQYPELRNQVNGGLTLVTEYSSTLNPFSPGTTPAKFVRTSITGLYDADESYFGTGHLLDQCGRKCGRRAESAHRLSVQHRAGIHVREPCGTAAVRLFGRPGGRSQSSDGFHERHRAR